MKFKSSDFLLFWITSWVVISIVFIPISYHFLPNIGIYLSRLILPVNERLCSILGEDIKASYFVSDSLASYSTGFILLILTFIITILIFVKGNEKIRLSIQKLLFLLAILMLSFFLCHYGLDKWFELQFYTPAANTLFTHVGQLDKDILYWTSMGTSSFYNRFMGFMELATGLFLLFNKTRFLALIVSSGIFLNIFAINIGFDITVKYLSGILLFTSNTCLFYYRKEIGVLLGKSYSTNTLPSISNNLILILFIPLLIELIITYQHVNPKTAGKSYEVISVDGKSKLISTDKLVRIHLHPDNYLVTEDNQQHFKSYKLSKSSCILEINHRQLPFRIDKNTCSWKEDTRTIQLEIKEINLQNLPLLQDKNHWYYEEIVR